MAKNNKKEVEVVEVVENAPVLDQVEPVEVVTENATKQENDTEKLAEAINNLANSKDEVRNFTFKADDTIEPRITLVKRKDGTLAMRERNEDANGEIYYRIIDVQTESIEEKKARLEADENYQEI